MRSTAFLSSPNVGLPAARQVVMEGSDGPSGVKRSAFSNCWLALT